MVEHVARAATRRRTASPLRPRARVEADRRRGRQVERLGAAPDAAPAPPRPPARGPRRAAPTPRCRTARPSGARGRARRPARARRRRAGRRGRARPAPSAARTVSPAARSAATVVARSAPVTTGRWNSEPAVDRTTLGLCTSTLSRGQHGGVGAGGVGGADDGPGVPGVAHVRQDRDEPRRRRASRQRVRGERRDRDDLLGVRAHGVEHLGRPDRHADAPRRCAPSTISGYRCADSAVT